MVAFLIAILGFLVAFMLWLAWRAPEVWRSRKERYDEQGRRVWRERR